MSLYNLSLKSSSALERDEAICQVGREVMGTGSDCEGGLIVPGVSDKVNGGSESVVEGSSDGGIIVVVGC